MRFTFPASFLQNTDVISQCQLMNKLLSLSQSGGQNLQVKHKRSKSDKLTLKQLAMTFAVFSVGISLACISCIFEMFLKKTF